jgi:hypothetical protein
LVKTCNKLAVPKLKILFWKYDGGDEGNNEKSPSL